MGKFVRDNGIDPPDIVQRSGIDNDYRPHEPPAYRRSDRVAREQCGSPFTSFTPFGRIERGGPAGVCDGIRSTANAVKPDKRQGQQCD